MTKENRPNTFFSRFNKISVSAPGLSLLYHLLFDVFFVSSINTIEACWLKGNSPEIEEGTKESGLDVSKPSHKRVTTLPSMCRVGGKHGPKYSYCIRICE